jgi:aminopeptidase-like protein
MRTLMQQLYPICRSITGHGVRRSLACIRESIPIEMHEVPSGTRVLDWVVPKEWNIEDAYVANRQGERIIDFRKHSLHVMSYSRPIRAQLSLNDLREHLFTLAEQPDLIPYKTSYYGENWGFCLSERQLRGMQDGEYEVVIDATLADGSLTYGELLLPGMDEDEILISTHICHPSLANDNLTGIAATTALAKRLMSRAQRRYSIRFLFVPGTIGPITWLARNHDTIARIKHGLVIAGIGDAGALTYKRSRRGHAKIDRAAKHVLSHWHRPGTAVNFEPLGYDERQYCSPGFNLPVGRISRTPFACYPEYHTSADDLDFVSVEQIEDALAAIEATLDILEQDAHYLNLSPHGEPQLGKRGLYSDISGHPDRRRKEESLLWTLNYCDGQHSILEIAEKAGRPFAELLAAASKLEAAGLLEKLV